jgi:hypothetical protein
MEWVLGGAEESASQTMSPRIDQSLSQRIGRGGDEGLSVFLPDNLRPIEEANMTLRVALVAVILAAGAPVGAWADDYRRWSRLC